MSVNEPTAPAHDRGQLLEEFEGRALAAREVMGAAMSILARVLPAKAVVATTARVKDFDSFFEKANKLRDEALRYPEPFDQITDVVGLRVVVIAQRNVAEVCAAVRSALEVIEEEDKAARLLANGQLGYESYHLVCRLGAGRAQLGEYSGLCDQSFEIQVRTALQHAWAENEHRIQYKQAKDPELRKRFLRLAAAISSADEEFDRIYEINERLQASVTAAAREAAQAGAEIVDDAAEDDAPLAKVSLMFGKKPSQLAAVGRYGEALQVYDRFIALQPKQLGHYVGRAKARAASGDIEGGLADLEAMRQLSPDHQLTRSLANFFARLSEDVDGGSPGRTVD